MSKSNQTVITELKDKLSRLKYGSKLTSTQTESIKSLIARNMTAFQWSDSDVGRTNLIEHD